MTEPKPRVDDIESPRQPTAVEDIAVRSDDPKNADRALDFLRKEKAGGESCDVDEKKLLRRIDFMVMPLMFSCYLLEYLDKSLCRPTPPMAIHLTSSLQ